MNKLLLSTALLILTGNVFAQSKAEEAEGDNERVQYALILPEEKTPEMVKPEENNPFEAAADSEQKEEGSSEENQVRDILLGLRAAGGASGPSGMRIMLGSMRLVVGATVPPVLPDQQVQLKVQAITPAGIELIWVEKKPSGLPPKVLFIPIDSAAKVRYRLPTSSSTNAGAGGNMGSIRRNGAPVLAPQLGDPVPPAQAVATRLEAEVNKALPPTDVPDEPIVAVTTVTTAPGTVTQASSTSAMIVTAPMARMLALSTDAPALDSEPAAKSEAPLKTDPVVNSEPISKGEPVAETAVVATSETSPAPVKSNAPEASVIRMLFGNHAPAAK